jgi:cytosine/adenosine deaminase-related metal-dependent hydrolase
MRPVRRTTSEEAFAVASGRAARALGMKALGHVGAIRVSAKAAAAIRNAVEHTDQRV